MSRSYDYPAIFRAHKTYVISASGTASTPQLLQFKSNTDCDPQAEIYCTANCTIKFGGASVTADSTVTDNAMPDGNIFCPGGAVRLFDVDFGNNYISVIGSGTVYVVTGFGEGGRR